MIFTLIFGVAFSSISDLPKSVRPAVLVSYRYYMALLAKIEQQPVEVIKTKRLRLSSAQKASLFAAQLLRIQR